MREGFSKKSFFLFRRIHEKREKDNFEEQFIILEIYKYMCVCVNFERGILKKRVLLFFLGEYTRIQETEKDVVIIYFRGNNLLFWNYIYTYVYMCVNFEILKKEFFFLFWENTLEYTRKRQF